MRSPCIDPDSLAAAPSLDGLSHALAMGTTALQRDEVPEAVRWLDRACRLTPGEVTPALLLASAVLGHDPGRARRILEQATRHRPPLRDIQLGLAVARFRQGDVAAAADLLHELLNRNAPPRTSEFRHFADAVVRASNRRGWVGLDAAGCLTVALSPDCCSRIVVVAADGRSRSIKQMHEFSRHRLHPYSLSAGMLEVTCGGDQLVGSPIALSARMRVEGVVRADLEGGINGCAWIAGDPETPPVLSVVQDANRIRLRLKRDPSVSDALVPAFARSFRLAPSRLDGSAPVRVVDASGRDLLGSPVYPPSAVQRPDGQRRRRGLRRAPVKIPARVPIDVVIPVFRGAADLLACLASLDRDLPSDTRIVIVDDGSTDQALRDALASLAIGRATVLRHTDNRGFPAAANTGLRHCTDAFRTPRDVLLLNPDTLVPPGLLARLARVAYSAAAIGSVTPMSNDGTIVSCDVSDTPLDRADVDRIDAWFAAANPDHHVDLPTGVGFCLFVRHDCLAQIGPFREDVFAQGYGEENDWCLRGVRRGWRHVAASGLFVAHSGGRSFGAGRALLMRRNAAVLARLHPDYPDRVAAFQARDPLRPQRRRVAIRRWTADADRDSVVFVTHDLGGGTERRVRERCAEMSAQGLRAIVLRLRTAPDTGPDHECGVGTAAGDRPDLSFSVPAETTEIVALLRGDRVRWMEIHHLGGLPPDILRIASELAIPYDLVVHDYALVCPRMTFCGPGGRYCGEPSDPAACESCVAAHGTRLHEDIRVDALRRRSSALAAAARAVRVPSEDVARRLRRYIRGVVPVVEPWEADPPPSKPAPPGRDTHDIRVCVVGALGQDKGYDILLDCAEDARARGLPLRFVVVGHTTGDAALLAAGVFVTGRFAEDEAVALIRDQGAQLGWLPSVCPETWSFALSALWRAGLPVASFALGTPAERIARTRRGGLIPLGTPPARINAMLLRHGGRDRLLGSPSAMLSPGAAA